MNTHCLYFWVPLIYDQPKNIAEKAGNLIEETLYLGGKKIHITSSNRMYEKHEEVGPRNIVLKVAAIFAVFLTSGLFLFMILGLKFIYRNIYKLGIKPTEESKFSLAPALMKELKKIGELCKKSNFINSNQIAKLRLGSSDAIFKYIFSIGKTNSLKIQRIAKTLGRGGFGVVYELVNLETNESTALKVAKPVKFAKGYSGYNSNDLNNANKDLLNEFKNLTFLNSTGKQVGIQTGPIGSILNIVSFNNNGTVRSKFCAFEEEIYTMSLDKLKVHTLPLRTRMEIIYQIVKGTHYYRRQGLVHSDLKPNNILCKYQNGTWVVDISDFGSAWTQNEKEQKAYTPAYTTHHDVREVQNSLTSAGRHWSGKKQDIYSLGLTLIEVLTGQRLDESNLNKASTLLYKAGLNETKYADLTTVLKRMLSKQEGMIIDTFKNLVGNKSVRPTINEVLNAVEKVL